MNELPPSTDHDQVHPINASPPGPDWHKLTGISTALLFLATVVAVAFAWYQTVEAAHARKAQDYLDLRKTFLLVDADLDKVDRDLVYSEAGGCPEWFALKRYWYFSETEWRVADIDSAQRDNWLYSQLPHITSGLKTSAFLGAFINMWRSPRWHDEKGLSFVSAVIGLSKPKATITDIDKVIQKLENGIHFNYAPLCRKPVSADAIHWYRDSAEMKGIYTQTYLAASVVAKDASKRNAPGTWGVILDIDETLLDNSQYQKSQQANSAAYSDASFLEWLKQQTATPLPGAAEFIKNVNDTWLGRVVLVTNQSPEQCGLTQQRLQTLQIHVDRILCDGQHTGDKNQSFTQVQNGDPAQHIPPLKVALWIGDNIRDFPALTQSEPSNLLEFGVHFFLLPNPMYGSWVDVARH